MGLTDKAVRAAKPDTKSRKLFDERGLYLLVHPNGSKYWRLKYRFQGREKTLALGVYPDTSLKAARNGRDEARRSVAQGIDPVAERSARKAATADSFEAVAREWLAKMESSWAPAHASRQIRRLEQHVYPYLGKHPVSTLTAGDILTVLRRIVDRGTVETSHRVLQIIGQVMRFAVVTGRAPADPASALRGALPASKASHHSAITDPTELGALLRSIDGYAGAGQTVRSALDLLAHTFVRPAELRHAAWAEIDFDAPDGALWAIPAERMKGDMPHLVPLSRQAVEILREIEPVTGRSEFVFPGARSYHRPLSDNALNAALRRMGYTKDQATAHGFRATARTLLDEVLGEPPHLIEHQLAHSVRDPLGRAYNRTSHLTERRKMMQRWSDYLVELRDTEKPAPPSAEVRARR